jgi:hypothetical protein
MNASLRIAALILAAAGLSACASGMEKSTYVQPQPVNSIVTDDAYVAVVERAARRRGIGVMWVNLPTKHLTKATE